MQAKTPIPAIKDHWLSVGLTQINGITKVTNMAPTTPVINNVNNGLSLVLNFRVIIK